MTKFTCTKCQQTKDETEFYKQSNSSTGYNRKCKECVNAYHANRRVNGQLDNDFTQCKECVNDDFMRPINLKLNLISNVISKANITDESKQEFIDYILQQLDDLRQSVLALIQTRQDEQEIQEEQNNHVQDDEDIRPDELAEPDTLLSVVDNDGTIDIRVSKDIGSYSDRLDELLECIDLLANIVKEMQ